MKSFPVLCLLLLTVAVIPASAWASGGRLESVEGPVFITPPGKAESQVKTGTELPKGTLIRTGKDGSAAIKFANGSRATLRPQTSLRLSGNNRQKKKSSVVLFFGRLWSKVSGTESRSYEIQTPNAVCGVRGTEFETAVGADGTTRVRVSEGKVAVGDENREVGPGSETQADESGVEEPYNAEEQAKWDLWEKRRRERLGSDGKKIVGHAKASVMKRKAEIERLRSEQKGIEAKRKTAERRARGGDRGAIAEIRKLNSRLAQIADRIADLGDAADSHLGYVDHLADLAGDPRFKMVGRKHLIAEAKNLRRVRADLDRLVAEGTDISIEGMEKMLDSMGAGGRGSLKGEEGSSVDDLFGGDDMLK